jgi:hypothetical protein
MPVALGASIAITYGLTVPWAGSVSSCQVVSTSSREVIARHAGLMVSYLSQSAISFARLEACWFTCTYRDASGGWQFWQAGGLWRVGNHPGWVAAVKTI